jgi:hypothetical protein
MMRTGWIQLVQTEFLLMNPKKTVDAGGQTAKIGRSWLRHLEKGF